MVEVQEETLAAVKEAEAEEVVPLEAEQRGDDDAREKGEGVGAGAAFVDEQLGAEGAVAIHVLDVGGERGVGVVEEVAVEGGGGAGETDGLVDGASFELGWDGKVAAEEAELGVGVEAAVLDPAAEEEIAALEEEGVGGWLRGEGLADLLLEFGGELFVGVEREDPVAGALGEGEVLLLGEAGPGAVEDSGVEAAGDVEGAVGGAGVDDDDLVGPGDAGEGAREVLFFVEGDDRDGQERHRGRSFLRRSFEELGEGDAGVVELLAEQAFGEGAEVFAGFGEGEGVCGFVPLQFVGGGERGDPDLANGGVGGEDELGGAVVEEDVEDAVLLVGLKAAGFFGAEERLLEGFQGLVGFVAEGGLVDHAETSVTVARAAGRGGVKQAVAGAGGFEVQGGVGEGEGLAGEVAEVGVLEGFRVSDGIASFVGLIVARGGDEQEAMSRDRWHPAGASAG